MSASIAKMLMAPAVESVAGQATTAVAASFMEKFRLPLTIVVSFLLFANVVTLLEMFVCKSFLNSTAKSYLWPTTLIGWTICVCLGIYIVLSVFTGGASVAFFSLLGFDPVSVGGLLLMMIIWSIVNSIALDVVTECRSGSRRNISTLLTLVHIGLSCVYLWQSWQHYM